ncbi:DUF3558 domain-containing protein [Nocardia sp. NPDC049707]|uniref:DUF3558 domain-containing protein n=1 Tax=Nocardia sp. NPDC049707 TaxID=3154735 RepID=UPI003444DCE4
MSQEAGVRMRTIAGAFLMTSVLVAGPLLAGCGSSGDGGATAASTTTTSLADIDVPRGYDPCKDIPASVLDSEKLHGQNLDNTDASGGVKWRGCSWIRSNGYAASITTTNLTVEMVRNKNFTDARELAIEGRRAISTRQVEEHPDAVCTINVEMKGGSLEFFLSNPPSRSETGKLDTCELARTLAEKIVPTIPATA